MTNHIHLQVETINHSISRIMQHLLTHYSKYYNIKYNLVGHLFQGRYQAEIIDDDVYMLQSSRYIHLNPVLARMVEKPIDYPWSSYSVYMGDKTYDLVSDYKILDYFLDNSRKRYKEYVENHLFADDVSDEVRNFEQEVILDGDASE